MLEAVRKNLLLSLSSVAVTKEKIEKAFEQLVQKGKLNQDEANSFMQELFEGEEQQLGEWQATLRDIIKSTLTSLDLCTVKEFHQLKKHVESIERRLSALESNVEIIARE